MVKESEERRRGRERLTDEWVVTVLNPDGSIKEIPGVEPPSEEALEVRRNLRERVWQILEETGAAQG